MTPRNQDKSAAATLRDGFALHQSGDLKGAEQCYRRILKNDKNHADALYLLGSLHLQSGDYKRAEAGLRAALTEQPNHAQALYNLARVLMDTDRYAEAETQLHLVISAQPNNVSALRNLGVTCLSLGKSKAAAPPLETAVQLDPMSADTWCDLGLARSQLGDDAGAEQAFSQAVTLDPALARARYNRGQLRLRNTNFTEGWADYECRKVDPKSGFEPRPYDYPVWQGEALAGKTILVSGEQGLGDQVLHAGMIKDLTERAAQVFLESEPRLEALLARSFPNVTVVPLTSPPHTTVPTSNVDFQVSSASLGQWLRPDSASFTSAPYLAADVAQVESLRQGYKKTYGDRPLIGLSWCSHRVGLGPHKSTDLVNNWQPIFEAQPEAVFISLQYGARSDVDLNIAAASQAFPNITIVRDPHIDTNKDIDAVVAQIAALDIVVSVSNTTVHLAGALGVPVWTLVPLGPSRLWYWLNRQPDSLWYPSMRLAWQEEIGVWDAAVDKVAVALSDWEPERI